MIRLLLGYNNTCHLQVAPMDCLTGESMKWSKTDQKLIKYLNLVIYFQSEIEHELWNINFVVQCLLCMPRPHPYCLARRHAPLLQVLAQG